MGNETFIDPMTRKEVEEYIDGEWKLYYSKMVEPFLDETEEVFEQANWRDIAKLFFSNGFINGAIKSMIDEVLYEHVSIIVDELDYQEDNGML